MAQAPAKPTKKAPAAFGGFTGISSASAVSGTQQIDQLAELADYLVGQGFTKAAAAGIASTVAGESTGSPESVGSGGAGLIGWTPASTLEHYGGTIHGNPDRDMETQAAALVKYAEANSAEAVARGGVNFATLKKATNAVDAAKWFSAFEGPLNPGSDERIGLISQIAAKIGLPISGLDPGGSSGGGAAASGSLVSTESKPKESNSVWGSIWDGLKDVGGIVTDPVQAELGVAESIGGFAKDFGRLIKMVDFLFEPSSWVRILSGMGGIILLILAAVVLYKAAGGTMPSFSHTPMPVPVPI